MPGSLIAGIILKMFIFISIGYILRKTGVTDAHFQNKLGNLLIKLIIPIAILVSANQELSPGQMTDFLLFILFSLGYYLVCMFLFTKLRKKLPLDEKKSALFANLLIFANVGLIGFPVIQQMHGSTGLLLAVFYNLFFNVFLFSFGVKQLGSRDSSLKQFLLSPIVISLIFTLALFFSPFRLPEIVAAPLQQIADTSAPLSMFVVGGSLAAMPLISILKNKWAYVVTAMRQIILPLIMMGLLYILGFRGMWPSVCVTLTALPTGTLNIITAEQYGGDVEFATTATVQGNVLMLATLPVILLLSARLFG